MMIRRLTALAAAGAVLISLLAGCGQEDITAPTGTQVPYEMQTIPSEAPTTAPETTVPEDSELQGTEIVCSGESAEISGSGADVKNGTVTIFQAGTYILSGTLEGQVLVEAKGQEVHLVLDGIAITNPDGPALYLKKAEKTTVTLAVGTENVLTDGVDYHLAADKSEPNACLFSKADLEIDGSGTLKVNGLYNHGIYSKDSLTIAKASITVDAVNDGIKGKDSIHILGAEVTVSAGGDGLQSNNSTDPELGFITIEGGNFRIEAGNDGIQAETALTIQDGAFEIQTGVNPSDPDSDSFKGLKAGGALSLNAGTFALTTQDDAIHSNGNVTISGGTYTIAAQDDGIHADEQLSISGGDISITQSYEGLEGKTIEISGGYTTVVARDDGVNAADGTAAGGFGRGGMGGGEGVFLHITGGVLEVISGGDGLDANGSLQMDGGLVMVSGPTSGADGALDYDAGGVINGGTLIAVGSLGMAQGFSSGEQCAFSVSLNGTAPAGTELTVLNDNGEVLFTYTPSHDYQSIVFTDSSLELGETYTVNAGQLTASVTMTQTIVGNSGGFGGGRPGGLDGGRGDRGQGPEGGMTPPEGQMPSPPDGGGPGGFGAPPGGFGGQPA